MLYEFSSVTIQIKSTQQIYAVQYIDKDIYIYTVKEKDEKLKQNTVFTLPSQWLQSLRCQDRVKSFSGFLQECEHLGH